MRAELQHFDEHHAVSCLERLGSIGRDAETEERLLGALLQRLDSGQMEISTLARLGAAAVSISLSDVVSLVTAKASQKANEFGNRDMAVLVRAMAMAGQGAAAEALVNGAALGRQDWVHGPWCDSHGHRPGCAGKVLLWTLCWRRLQVVQTGFNHKPCQTFFGRWHPCAIGTRMPYAPCCHTWWIESDAYRHKAWRLGYGPWQLCVRVLVIPSPDLDGLKRMQFCACRLKPFGASRHLVPRTWGLSPG